MAEKMRICVRMTYFIDRYDKTYRFENYLYWYGIGARRYGG